jgi:hypothetical protein
MSSPFAPVPTARGAVAAAFVLVGAVVAAYWNSRDGPFVFDDVPAIVENATLRDLRQALHPPADRGLPVTGRPLVNLSLAVNYAIGGLTPRGYHLGNVALHALAALALFGLVRRTLLLFLGNSVRVVAGLAEAGPGSTSPATRAPVSSSPKQNAFCGWGCMDTTEHPQLSGRMAGAAPGRGRRHQTTG